VLINLLLNAIEASPDQGTVKLTAANLGLNLCIRISDEGPAYRMMSARMF